MRTTTWGHRRRAAVHQVVLVLKRHRTLELTRSSRRRHEPGTIIASTSRAQKFRHSGGKGLV